MIVLENVAKVQPSIAISNLYNIIGKIRLKLASFHTCLFQPLGL